MQWNNIHTLQLKLLGQERRQNGPPAEEERTPGRRRNYVLPVGSWECDYDFRVNNTGPTPPGSYPDFRLLRITGRLIRPNRLAGRLLEAIFFSEHNLRQLTSSEAPKVVGRIQPRGRTTTFEVILNMPEDVLPTVISMLLDERWQYLILHGTQFTLRLAQVRSYRFTTTRRIEEAVGGAARAETD